MSDPVGVRASPGSRGRVILAALLAGGLTALSAAGLGATTNHVWGASGYLALVGFSILAPASIWAQVVAGQLMAAALMLGADAAPWWQIVPLVAGVVATAELAGIAARLDVVVARPPVGDLRRAGRAVVVAAIAFAGVALAAALPGPAGFAAVMLASLSCAGVALLFSGRSDETAEPGT